ncbi:unnamed protein product [Gordionus sp. m RMFG-2023]|uniref:DDB1- and CUL4-associated factor 11-like n=1 Tax=Gordionus sp. m RMFG-2023 TaxID=3053472 RepID=UPI0030E44461
MMMRIIEKRKINHNDCEGFSLKDICTICSRFIPNSSRILQRYNSKAFCSILNTCGNLLLTSAQDDKIRLYDLKNCCIKSNVLNNVMDLKLNRDLQKTFLNNGIQPLIEYSAHDVGWSILDIAINPLGTKFIYSSWSKYVHECDIFDLTENVLTKPSLLNHNALQFFEPFDTRQEPDENHFCIFSLSYSPNGSEIIGGSTNGGIHIYDKEINKKTLLIRGHEHDVNAVAFLNASDILLSGGDDGLVKVWDRRNLNESNPQPVGVWAGHSNGITFLDSKKDDRYLISNSKDQSIKLWDARKFSGRSGQEEALKAVSNQDWDYRWERIPESVKTIKKLKGDSSVMTYSGGHSILYTLIRCRFSPIHTTDQRFIVTGCSTGKIAIYDLQTGNLIATIMGHTDCVRDVFWHPFTPDFFSASWDGSIRHSYYMNTIAFESML